jgi:hypothetical protein
MFLLRIPWFKFILRLLSNVAASVLIPSLDIRAFDEGAEAAPAAQALWYVMLLWSIAGLLSEVQMFAPSVSVLKQELRSLVSSAEPSLYRSDAFNLADMLTWILLLAGLLSETSTATILISLSSVCSWYRLLRMLTLSNSLGPLVLMLVQMTKDVVRLLVIKVFVVVMVSSGLFILINAAGPPNIPEAKLNDPHWKCAAFLDMFPPESGGFSRWQDLLFVLANAAISGETYTDCLIDESVSSHWIVAWVLSFTFNILTAVLLMNMLIAMMAKSAWLDASLPPCPCP